MPAAGQQIRNANSSAERRTNTSHEHLLREARTRKFHSKPRIPLVGIIVNNDLIDSSGTVTSGINQIQFSDGSTVNLGQATPATFTWFGTSNASLSGSNYGANTFELGSGSESATGGNTTSGGNGNNTYIASSSTGQATIYANEAAGSTNELDFTGGISDENLWFQQSGNDLKIDLVGTRALSDYVESESALVVLYWSHFLTESRCPPFRKML